MCKSHRNRTCCLDLSTVNDPYFEVIAKACGGNLPDEVETVLVSVPDCSERCEDGDLFCEEIYADSCEDPNTHEPNTGPVVPPGIYAPTGNFRYVETDPLPTWASFLANRAVDSLNDDVGVFGRGATCWAR